MGKSNLLAVALCGLLWVPIASAQEQGGTTITLTLNQIFALAEQNSKQLSLARTGIDAAREATGVARSARLPSVDASLSLSYLGDGTVMDRDLSNSTRAPMPHYGNSFAIEASQVIFAGGAISGSIAISRLQEQVAQLALDKDRTDLRFLLTGYYLDLYKLTNQRSVYLHNIEQTRMLIREIQSKQRQGMALTSDVTRHELNLQNLELSLIEINNSCDILNHHLVTTLGLPQNTIIQADSAILEMTMGHNTPEDLLATAAANLPELKSAQASIDIADQGVRIAKADYLPTLAVVAANHFDGPITIEVPAIDKNFNYWYVGVGLRYNISSLFKSKSNVNLARSRQTAAITRQELAIEQAQIAIHSAATRYKESFEKLRTVEKSFELSTENYRIINNRYLNDLVLITEMLDASNTKLNAELQVVNARINIIYSYYKLQRTVGKL